ncbi:MAG: hypothetical protein HGA87_00920 [Desulfobulbaceae bacterium]|nr:hypothetical protein [Desulfobulbaceae bacterium]
MKEPIVKLDRRSGKAWEETEMNRGIWDDVYEFYNPYRNNVTRVEGDKSHRKPVRVYDSTAGISAVNFVNTMTSKFYPIFSRWAELKSGVMVPKESRKAQDQALQVITETLEVYRNNSNFYTASGEKFFELGIGTAPMLIVEGDQTNPLTYVPLVHGGYAIEEGRYGSVSALFRKHKVRLRLVKETWKGAKLTGEMTREMTEKPDDDREFQEAFYYDFDGLVWRQEVWCGKEKASIFSATYPEQPFTCPRWMKVPGMASGIGPFMLALADVKTLNKMKELQMQMAAMNAFGMYTIKRGDVLNPNVIRITAGAFIPVTDAKDIQRLDTAGNFQVQEYMLDDLKTQIRQTMLDNRLPAEKYGQGTAFEVAQRLKELQTDIGAAFGRLIYEDVQPLIRREISILARKGLIDLPQGFAVDNLYTTVQVVSPIAQEQKFSDVQKFVNAWQVAAGISPELAMASFKVEDVPAWVAEQLGVPASLQRSEAERAQLQQMVAQIIAQMQAQQAQAAQ